MKPADLNFVKRLAATKGVTLADAGVRQGQTLGYAIDSVLAAAEGFGGEIEPSRCTCPPPPSAPNTPHSKVPCAVHGAPAWLTTGVVLNAGQQEGTADNGG